MIRIINIILKKEGLKAKKIILEGLKSKRHIFIGTKNIFKPFFIN